MITLTEEERRRFADWLGQDAESDELMIDQLRRIAPPLAKVREAEIAASRLIAKKLRSITTL